jgi:hypothetical protein
MSTTFRKVGMGHYRSQVLRELPLIRALIARLTGGQEIVGYLHLAAVLVSGALSTSRVADWSAVGVVLVGGPSDHTCAEKSGS